MNSRNKIPTWEMLKLASENPNIEVQKVGKFFNTEWVLFSELKVDGHKGSALVLNGDLWNVRGAVVEEMSPVSVHMRLGIIDGRKCLVTSFKDYATLDTRPSIMTDDQYIQLIKSYNDCFLFSSDHDRYANQENRHIHFLLKYIERMKHGQSS